VLFCSVFWTLPQSQSLHQQPEMMLAPILFKILDQLEIISWVLVAKTCLKTMLHFISLFLCYQFGLGNWNLVDSLQYFSWSINPTTFTHQLSKFFKIVAKLDQLFEQIGQVIIGFI
jgi:hypothetical protein